MENKSIMRKPLLVGCGIIAFVGVAIFVGLTIWVLVTPEGGVRLANEIEDYTYEYFEDHDILRGSEEIYAYYDNTLDCDGSEAAVLTNERVIYINGERVMSVEIIDIVDVKHHYVDFTGDVIEITTMDGKPMKIEIAPFNSGETFYNALIDLWGRSVEIEEII